MGAEFAKSHVFAGYRLSHVHSGSCLPSQNNPVVCQAETLAKRLEEVQTELQEQRTTGGLGLGAVPAIMQPPNRWFDVFF